MFKGLSDDYCENHNFAFLDFLQLKSQPGWCISIGFAFNLLFSLECMCVLIMLEHFLPFHLIYSFVREKSGEKPFTTSAPGQHGVEDIEFLHKDNVEDRPKGWSLGSAHRPASSPKVPPPPCPRCMWENVLSFCTDGRRGKHWNLAITCGMQSDFRHTSANQGGSILMTIKFLCD